MLILRPFTSNVENSRSFNFSRSWTLFFTFYLKKNTTDLQQMNSFLQESYGLKLKISMLSNPRMITNWRLKSNSQAICIRKTSSQRRTIKKTKKVRILSDNTGLLFLLLITEKVFLKIGTNPIPFLTIICPNNNQYHYWFDHSKLIIKNIIGS